MNSQETLKEKLLSLDPFLIFFMSCLTVLGFVSLYSAAGGQMEPWTQKQVIRFCLGFCVMVAVALVDVRFWRTVAYATYALNVLLLIFVEAKGHIGMGAQRWIDLGFMHLQPSELMKITLISALACYFHQQTTESLKYLRTYIIPIIFIAIPCGLVMRQPDLGTMLILLAVGSVIIFMAGIQFWKVIVAFVLSIAALPILWLNMHTYQKKRVLTFLNPENDPLGSGYHIMQSKIAIGSAGFWGKGYLSGTQSQLQFLPEKQTDFIFAHFIEEFGFLGGSFLLLLYGLFVLTLLKMSLECKSYFCRLYLIGFQSLVFFYVFINIGMVMGILPVVGVPLPFMSYGGTSLLSLLLGTGFALSCHRDRNLRFGQTYT